MTEDMQFKHVRLDQLKRCPSCGATAMFSRKVTEVEFTRVKVVCRECKLQTTWFDSWPNAAISWNARISQSAYNANFQQSFKLEIFDQEIHLQLLCSKDPHSVHGMTFTKNGAIQLVSRLNDLIATLSDV